MRQIAPAKDDPNQLSIVFLEFASIVSLGFMDYHMIAMITI